MPPASELAWLIPVLPLAGATLVGLGLISFNRTVNRLKVPVAVLLIRPRRPGGAHSAVYAMAPVYSPPTAMPCTHRSSTSSSGASTPTWS